VAGIPCCISSIRRAWSAAFGERSGWPYWCQVDAVVIWMRTIADFTARFDSAAGGCSALDSPLRPSRSLPAEFQGSAPAAGPDAAADICTEAGAK